MSKKNKGQPVREKVQWRSVDGMSASPTTFLSFRDLRGPALRAYVPLAQQSTPSCHQAYGPPTRGSASHPKKAQSTSAWTLLCMLRLTQLRFTAAVLHADGAVAGGAYLTLKSCSSFCHKWISNISTLHYDTRYQVTPGRLLDRDWATVLVACPNVVSSSPKAGVGALWAEVAGTTGGVRRGLPAMAGCASLSARWGRRGVVGLGIQGPAQHTLALAKPHGEQG
ncbi:hypothetical protein BJV78DRAFT_622097 [Lactifluus subvellereus]|nr:hypothetical protein BJV78DRAFT_622097 [Lactifluus subvellereus]